LKWFWISFLKWRRNSDSQVLQSVSKEQSVNSMQNLVCISISLVARASNAPDLGNPQSDLSAWNDFCRENDA